MTVPNSRFDARWLEHQKFPPVQYVVPELIPEGLTLLVAAPKIGKSWMVLGLGISVSLGQPAFGSIPTGAPRPVLYLALEDGQRRLQQRMRSLAPDMWSPLLEFQVDLEQDVVTTVANYFQAHQDAVVVLDTLGKVLPSTGSTQTQYAADYQFMGALKKACDAVPGSSLIVVHHTRKAGGEDFLDAVSGTQGIAGAADTICVLRRDRKDQGATLQVTSRDAREGEYGMTLAANGAWSIIGRSLKDAAASAQLARTTAGLSDRMSEVIELASAHPEGIRAADVAAELSMDEKMAGTYLGRAFDQGRLAKPARGLYTPVGSVESVGTGLASHSLNTFHTHSEALEAGAA